MGEKEQLGWDGTGAVVGIQRERRGESTDECNVGAVPSLRPSIAPPSSSNCATIAHTKKWGCVLPIEFSLIPIWRFFSAQRIPLCLHRVTVYQLNDAASLFLVCAFLCSQKVLNNFIGMSTQLFRLCGSRLLCCPWLESCVGWDEGLRHFRSPPSPCIDHRAQKLRVRFA